MAAIEHDAIARGWHRGRTPGRQDRSGPSNLTAGIGARMPGRVKSWALCTFVPPAVRRRYAAMLVTSSAGSVTAGSSASATVPPSTVNGYWLGWWCVCGAASRRDGLRTAAKP